MMYAAHWVLKKASEKAEKSMKSVLMWDPSKDIKTLLDAEEQHAGTEEVQSEK